MRACTYVLAFVLAAVQGSATPAPWERTEAREPCAAFTTLRSPYVGETHVHTKFSFDAVQSGINHGPREAYQFAQGQALDLPIGTTGSRTVQLRRPLDFTAVTDHAETFGEIRICLTEGLSGHDSTDCSDFRSVIPVESASAPGGPFLGYLVDRFPVRVDFCGVDGSNCRAEASPVWQEMQDAAEQFYDRSSACGFTTFVAYEYSGFPGFRNLHRNVIFRNEVVPVLPTSHVEAPTPELLWTALEIQCLQAGTGCDVLAIPHNSNLSDGTMFLAGNGLTAEAAAFRAELEPVVEIVQHKGESECHSLLSPADELCGFEKKSWDFLGGAYVGFAFVPETTGFVRTALMEGLLHEERMGANPFRFGVIGATDTHNATPGLTNEEDYADSGHTGTRDATPELQLTPIDGVAVLGDRKHHLDALLRTPHAVGDASVARSRQTRAAPGAVAPYFHWQGILVYAFKTAFLEEFWFHC